MKSTEKVTRMNVEDIDIFSELFRHWKDWKDFKYRPPYKYLDS